MTIARLVSSIESIYQLNDRISMDLMEISNSLKSINKSLDNPTGSVFIRSSKIDKKQNLSNIKEIEGIKFDFSFTDAHYASMAPELKGEIKRKLSDVSLNNLNNLLEASKCLDETVRKLSDKVKDIESQEAKNVYDLVDSYTKDKVAEIKSSEVKVGSRLQEVDKSLLECKTSIEKLTRKCFALEARVGNIEPRSKVSTNRRS